MSWHKGRVTFLPMSAGFSPLMDHHRHLIDDRVRTGRFLDAIGCCVKAGDVVIDLGTGTGILAFAARRAGARRVIAIDQGAVVGLAAQIGRDNGIEGIEWRRGVARELSMSTRCDVLVSECFGPMAVGGAMLDEVLRIRDRWLAPGGVLIPDFVELQVAPVESASIFEDVTPWRDPRHGLDWSAARSLALNNLYNVKIEPGEIVSEPAPLTGIDMHTASPDRVRGGRLVFESGRDGTLHGLAGWFRARLAPQIWLETGPEAPETVWRQVFMPFEALPLRRGQRIEVEVSFEPTVPGRPPVASWSVTSGAAGSEHSVRASFPHFLPAFEDVQT